MDDNARATAISSKFEEVNITAAVRILCSDDKPAPINAETLEELRLKHPSPPVDHQLPPRPPTAIHLQVTKAEVTSRVCTFPAGSSGCPDGLRLQHIYELCSCAEVGCSNHRPSKLSSGRDFPSGAAQHSVAWHTVCLTQKRWRPSTNSNRILLAKTIVKVRKRLRPHQDIGLSFTQTDGGRSNRWV